MPSWADFRISVTSFIRRSRAQAAGVFRIVRAYPSTLLWPLLLLGLVLGLGVWGVIRVAQVEENSTKEQAANLALSAAVWFQQQLSTSVSPVMLMSAMVGYNPQYDAVSSLFAGMAAALLAQAPQDVISLIEYLPNGVVTDAYPVGGNTIGFDVFNSSERDAAIKTIEENVTTLSGPIDFVGGGYGFVVRIPIFVSGVEANETFGINVPLSPLCGAACNYNATTRTKFWGFAAALIDIDALRYTVGAKLQMLADMGFNYEIGLLGKGEPSLVASSHDALTDPVEVGLRVEANDWVVRVSPDGSWRSSAFGGLLACVIVMAVAMAVILFAALVSRKRHQMLLEALLPKEVIKDLHGTDTTLLDARILQADTTADLMLTMLNRLLEGDMPDLRDVVFIRQAICRGADLYQPMDLTQHIRNANLDKDVARALMLQLGHETVASSPYNSTDDPLFDEDRFRTSLRAPPSFATKAYTQQQQQDYSTLAGALAIILNPQPTSWRDTMESISGETTFDVTLPHREFDTVGTSSPRPTSLSFLGKAITFLREGTSGNVGAIGSNAAASLSRPSVDSGPLQEQRNGHSLEAPCRMPDSLRDVPASAMVGDEDRLSPQSTSAQDDCAFRSSLPVRRPPRKVASALGATGLASSLRRCSLLQSITTAAGFMAGPVPSAPNCGRRTSSVYFADAPMPALLEPAVGVDLSANRMVLNVNNSRRSMLAGASRAAILTQKAQSMAPPPPIIEEVERVLARADTWQFDTWRLREVTNGHPLSALGFYLIQRAGLITRFNLKPGTLARLLRQIEGGYVDNSYHNATHAADVLQTLHVIVHGAQLHVHYLDQLGLLAAYFAAIVHDYGHPGLTNDFLVATSHPLAVRYNDRSPLENHHAAASFSLLQRPGLDVLAPFSKADKMSFRKQVIDMVLATDVKQHFALLSQFNTAHRLASFAHIPSAERAVRGNMTSCPSGNHHIELRDIVVDITGSLELSAPKPLDDTERLLSLQLAIKAADLGHLGERLDVHKKWLSGLEEEFFLQGDKERQLGIPISPLFDRAKQGVSKSQVGFYDFVALPLAHALSSAFPGSQPLMTCFLGNYNHWRSVEGQPPVNTSAATKSVAHPVRGGAQTSASQVADL